VCEVSVIVEREARSWVCNSPSVRLGTFVG
jgi:hypothetical protein